MEGAVIGYVPYVQPASSSSIPDCFQENSFIHLPRSTNGPDCAEQDKMLNTSSAEVNSEQDSALELTSNVNEDRKRLFLKSKNSAIAGKSELSERKGVPADIDLPLRLVIDETPTKVNQAVDTKPVQNEDKGSRVPLKRSSSAMQEPKSEQTSQAKKLCVENENGLHISPLNEVGSNDSGSDNMDKISSNAELCAMNASMSSSVNIDNSDISPRSSPVDPEASESSGKKRYLFDFRPNTHQIIVKTKSGEKSFKCFVCCGIYQQKFSLKRHYLRNHIDYRYISENDISNCNIPVPRYIKKLNSNLDYKKASNGRKKFKKSNNDIFLDNNDEHLMPGLYRCHDCPNITFDTELELKDHYNKHPEAVKKKFHCEVCDASFFKKQILSRHLASHGKKKVRFECKKCNSDFATQGELILHSDSHTTGKTCKYCGKTLSTSANRKRHEALHLGLKPYNCTLCGSSFAQSKDLDRHLRKQHSEFCRECPKCNKLFSTEANLENHIKEKHSEPSVKKQDPSASNTEKESNAKLPVAASIPSAKPKSCTVCKRTFHTVYAMLKHKRQAHPYYSRKKRRVKQKVGRSKEMSSNLEFRKTYTQSQKVFDSNSVSPVKRGRPIQKPSTPKDAEKYVRRNGRPGPRSVSKKEEESFKEFYGNVAYEINKNILHHIDGRATQLSLKQYNFNDCPYSAEFFEEQGRLPWSHYNFPLWYDVDNALKTRGQEIRRPENLSSQDEFLYDATGLAPCNRIENSAVLAENNVEVQVAESNDENTHLSLEGRKKLVGREVIIVTLCCVCKETFNSHEDFEQHNVNNHPNVEPNFLEFIGDKEKPPEVPPEFRTTYLSPVGHRFSCDVPPSVIEGCVKCTKCKSEFLSRGELYGHLTVCGNLNSSARPVWKKNASRRIKNTMKNRMSTAEQHATLHAVDDYMTPEKLEPKSNYSYSTGRGSKSTEKLQFYKSGRLQTTSLTVDMNYFNTKPTKPAKNGSKRGRKSYALVSSMYRNATMQATTSRECSDCRTTFPSIAALNQHHKSQHPELRNEDLGKVPVNGTPDRIQNATEQNKMNAQCPTNSSPRISRPRVNLFPPTPAIGVAADNVAKSLFPFKAQKPVDLTDSQPADAPIDLSTNPCDRNETTLNENVQQRSALQIAMDAVLKFSLDSDAGDQKSKNVHISKLQETVEKLTVPTMPSVSKHNVVRKVGRPRKLKKDDSPSPPLNFNSGLLGIGSPGKSKPISRLEEAVERLKSKVTSQEKNRENSVSSTSVTDKGSLVSQKEKLTEISNLKEPVQPILSNDKEKAGQTIVNNSSAHKSVSTSIKDNDKTGNTSNATDKVVSEIKNQTVDKPALKGKTGDKKESIVISEKTSPTKKVATVDKQQLPNVNFEENGGIQRIPALSSSSEFSVPEQSPEKAKESSHGRSSPTFDSILKVINQKLHSEEESSQHDDTVITWLEDEKFEIPPSRGNLNIMMNAGASVELTSIENKSSGSNVIDIPSGNDNLTPSMFPEKLEDTKMASKSPNSELAAKHRQPEESPNKIASAKNEAQTLPKEQTKVQKETPKVSKTVISISEEVIQETVSSNNLERTLKASKEIKNSPECRPLARRGPGRPRKRLVENVDTGSQVKTGKENASPSKPIEAVKSVEKNIVPGNMSSTENDVSSPQSSQKSSDSPHDVVKPSNEARSVKCSENEEHSSLLSNSDEPGTANQSEQPAVSLRTFRTKAKQSQCDSNAKSSFPLKNNITTEFGKSLASKMKEKMRLSFEQDSSKSANKVDESTSFLSKNICDANAQLRDKLKAVKKECGDTVEPTKIHSCPYCMLEFAYLTNFRRHLKACLARTESKEADSTPGNSTTNLQHLPKKDEVDYSMLNLYRHQSRQTQMLKEVKENLGSDTPIKKYECTVCHRIYLNLFTFLQHKITQHNLAPQSSSEANASNDSPSCSSEINDIGNTFAADVSTSDPSQQENDLKLGGRVNYESLIDSFISEENNEFVVDDPPVCDFTETNCQADSAINEPECPTLEVQSTEVHHEDTDESQPPDLPVDSNDNESMKDEAIPVKRKRGRPFGWRKNVNVPEDNQSVVERKKVTQNLSKKGVLIYKRVGRPPSSAMSSSKLKSKAKKVPLNKVDITRVKTEPVDSDTNSVRAESTKSEKSDPQNRPVKIKEEVLDAPKPPVTVSLSDDDFVDLKAKKLSKSSHKTKNASPAEVETNNRAVKRGRGRSLTPVAGVTKTPTSTPEMPSIKRRPGRPPKNLQCTAGPSQPMKHIASGLPMRSGRKIMPVTVESSDSECELVKPEIPVKKKINKICPICKKKFLSTLALHRHTQIKHSRRTQPAATSPKTTDLPAKVSKKSPSKSPVTNTSDGDTEVVAKKVEAVVKLNKICPICKNKFVTAADVRLHIQTFHSRKSEPGPVKLKSPSPERPEVSGNQRPVANKNKTIENFTRSSLTRQCRKSLPLLPKRVKKQSPEQMKKQKL